MWCQVPQREGAALAKPGLRAWTELRSRREVALLRRKSLLRGLWAGRKEWGNFEEPRAEATMAGEQGTGAGL